jgi:hypothetical protein
VIVLAFFGGVLVLVLAAAVFYDRRARRRGLRPGMSERDVAIREGTSAPGGDSSMHGGGVGGP